MPYGTHGNPNVPSYHLCYTQLHTVFHTIKIFLLESHTCRIEPSIFEESISENQWQYFGYEGRS